MFKAAKSYYRNLNKGYREGAENNINSLANTESFTNEEKKVIIDALQRKIRKRFILLTIKHLLKYYILDPILIIVFYLPVITSILLFLMDFSIIEIIGTTFLLWVITVSISGYIIGIKESKETYDKYGNITHLGGKPVYSSKESKNYIDENGGYVTQSNSLFFRWKNLHDKNGIVVGKILD